MTTKMCRTCGGVITRPKAYAYCSSECSAQAIVERDRSRRATPCRRCGGPKETRRGAKYCDGCRQALLPNWQQAAIERDRRKSDQAFQERIASGGRIGRRYRDVPDGSKWCAHCQSIKPVEAFAGGVKVAAYCRPCASDYNFEKKLATQFGLTREQYELLLTQQEGCCAICRRRPRKMRLAVDHDHKTGVVRGLLCTFCNHRLLGSAQEDPEILRRAARYLEHPPGPAALLAEEGQSA